MSEEEAPAKERDRTFGAMLAACGLSLHDAVIVLGQSFSAIDKKARGVRAYSQDDADALGAILRRIRDGDTAGLPDGCRRMADALAIMRGARKVPLEGRRPKKAESADPKTVTLYQKLQLREQLRAARKAAKKKPKPPVAD